MSRFESQTISIHCSTEHCFWTVTNTETRYEEGLQVTIANALYRKWQLSQNLNLTRTLSITLMLILILIVTVSDNDHLQYRSFVTMGWHHERKSHTWSTMLSILSSSSSSASISPAISSSQVLDGGYRFGRSPSRWNRRRLLRRSSPPPPAVLSSSPSKYFRNVSRAANRRRTVGNSRSKSSTSFAPTSVAMETWSQGSAISSSSSGTGVGVFSTTGTTGCNWTIFY